MLRKILHNWGLRRSEGEIVSFLTLLSAMDPEDNGPIFGMAALIHHQYGEKNPEFRTILNSKKGDDVSNAINHIVDMNPLISGLSKSGRKNEAAAMRLWSITLRCMLDDKFHNYGVSLWETVPKSFPVSKSWIAEKLSAAERSGNTRDAKNLQEALKIYNFVPPRFSAANNSFKPKPLRGSA